MNNKKTVFITGAATGIGKTTACKLDSEGWDVFAGVLPNQDTTDLRKGCSTRLQVVEIDITNVAMIQKAVEIVAKQVGEKGLTALINNAGVANIGSGVLAGVNMAEVRTLFEINVFGTLQVTQAFLPLLHQYGAARIVSLSSGAARVPVPTAGAYMMSKLAVEGMTKTLRIELAPLGIQATAIEPGAVRTPMTDNAEENMSKVWETIPDDVRQIYEPLLRPANKNLAKSIEDANEPEVIAHAIHKALTAKTMRPRYTVGKEVTFLPMAQRLMSEPMFENVLLKQFGLKRKAN